MLLGPGMIRTFIALLLLATPAAARRHARSEADDKCVRLVNADPDLPKKFAGARLTDLSTLRDEDVQDLAGGRLFAPIARDEAIAFAARLAQSGLFSAVGLSAAGDDLE